MSANPNQDKDNDKDADAEPIEQKGKKRKPENTMNMYSTAGNANEDPNTKDDGKKRYVGSLMSVKGTHNEPLNPEDVMMRRSTGGAWTPITERIPNFHTRFPGALYSVKGSRMVDNDKVSNQDKDSEAESDDDGKISVSKEKVYDETEPDSPEAIAEHNTNTMSAVNYRLNHIENANLMKLQDHYQSLIGYYQDKVEEVCTVMNVAEKNKTKPPPSLVYDANKKLVITSEMKTLMFESVKYKQLMKEWKPLTTQSMKFDDDEKEWVPEPTLEYFYMDATEKLAERVKQIEKMVSKSDLMFKMLKFLKTQLGEHTESNEYIFDVIESINQEIVEQQKTLIEVLEKSKEELKKIIKDADNENEADKKIHLEIIELQKGLIEELEKGNNIAKKRHLELVEVQKALREELEKKSKQKKGPRRC